MCNPELKERYVNFYTDFAFKKLFGTEVNKELLISFLNSLFDGIEVIKDLSYLNVEHLGAAAAERKAVFDVYCENEKGEKFLIEMQKAEQSYFIDRSIYYSTFPIQEQAPKGKWNFELKKVYTVGILNFTFDEENPEYLHHEVKLMDTKTKEVFYDKLTYVYLEMPKFKKTEEELVTILDKWLYAMKNLSSLIERPKSLVDAVFLRFFEQAEIANFTPQELSDYRESQKDYWDLFSVVETAENKGVARGLEEGIAIGEERGIAIGEERATERERQKAYEEKLDIARNMKEEGMPVAVIAKCTGLPESDIEALRVHSDGSVYQQ